MKKILIATGVYPPESGGPATYTKLLEERLPPLGYSVEALPFRRVRHLPKLIRHAAYFVLCLRRGAHADVIYAQDTVSVGLPASLAALVLRKPFLVRIPGDYAWEQSRQRPDSLVPIEEFQEHYFGLRVAVLRAVQRFVVARAARVVAPSEFLRRLCVRWGADEARVVRIYNGLSFPVPQEAPAQRPEGFFVVSVGRRVPWKGFEALERICKEEGWPCYIAETDPRPQALGWVAAADAFVLNSSYEGLSHTLIESMSLGAPIVATNIGGNPELIEDGVQGLLIPARDDEALRAALRRLKEDRALAARLGAAARERAGEFSIERTLEGLVALLKTL